MNRAYALTKYACEGGGWFRHERRRPSVCFVAQCVKLSGFEAAGAGLKTSVGGATSETPGPTWLACRWPTLRGGGIVALGRPGTFY
jgi:hypothetical protein